MRCAGSSHKKARRDLLAVLLGISIVVGDIGFCSGFFILPQVITALNPYALHYPGSNSTALMASLVLAVLAAGAWSLLGAVVFGSFQSKQRGLP